MTDNIKWKKVETENNDFLCKKCKSNDLKYHEEESFCGSWDFFVYHCNSCGYSWKSEGIDS